MKLSTHYTPFGLLVMAAFAIPFYMMFISTNGYLQAAGFLIFCLLMVPYMHIEKLGLFHVKIQKKSDDTQSAALVVIWFIGIGLILFKFGFEFQAIFWAHILSVVVIGSRNWLETDNNLIGETE